MAHFKLTSEASNPDIIAVTESWLNADIQDAEVLLPSYSLIRSDRIGIHGGVAIYYKDSLFVQDCVMPSINSNTVEMAACTVKTSTGVLNILVVYRSPVTTTEDSDKLLSVLKHFTQLPGDYLIMGDFNAPEVNWTDWFCSSQTSFASKLLNFADSSFTSQSITFPTRFERNARPSVLDLVFHKYPRSVINIETSAPLDGSDHLIIFFDFLTSLPRASPFGLRRCFARTDERALLAAANAIIWPALADSPTLEEDWSTLKASLLELTGNFTPLQSARQKEKKPWFTSKHRRALAAKNAAFRNYQSSLTDAAFTVYKQQSQLLSRLLRKSRRSFEAHLARNITTRPKLFFSHVQRNKHVKNRISTLKDLDGSVTTNPSRQSEIFCTFFESVYRHDSGLPAPDLPPPATIMPQVTITAAEVHSKLSNLDVSKGSGPDGLHPKILSILAGHLAIPLANLFNRSLAEGLVPNDWRHAVICPIFKKGVRDDAANYRPISLTCVLCKVMESLVKDKLLAFLQHTKAISPAQHGFVPRRSCLTNLLVAEQVITKILDSRQAADVVFIDFSKAFDSVNHRLLKAKLISVGINPNLVTWIEAFLAERTFQVLVNDAKSPTARAESGVPQGSVLGPLLFLLYVNDIPSVVSSFCLLFADDVKLIAPRFDWQQLQEDLRTFHRWSSEWDLPINASKCAHLPIGRPPPMILTFNPTVEGQEITESAIVKDLGVLANTSFTPTSQCIAAASKARGMVHLIRRSFVEVTPRMFKPLYNTLVLPHLEYAVQAWCPYQTKDIDLLEKVQRMATRMVKGLRELRYEERLKALNLFSLERRRRRADLITCFNIHSGRLDVPADFFFEPSLREGLRREGSRLRQPTARLNRRKFSFASRVVADWNRLPFTVTTATSTADFKRKLDACWDANLA